MANELTASFKKRFPSEAIIEADFRLRIDPPTITVLFGPSGCGKTTILRSLAGLERPETGRILLGDEVWMDTEQGVFVPPRKRRIGYLFQEYALFPHLTARQNIAYGLSRLPGSEREKQVAAMRNLFQLDGLEDRYPDQLSGGEKQRVALARTLAVQPQLLLLDEPLSALDTPIRERLRAELGEFLRGLQVPTLLVTHDRTEAQALADQLIVVTDGRSQQTGPVDEVFAWPANEKVARCVGFETVVPAKVIGKQGRWVTLEINQRRFIALNHGSLSNEVLVCIRAEDVSLRREVPMPNGETNEISGMVIGLSRDGRAVRVLMDCGFLLTAFVDREVCGELGIQKGQTATAFIRAEAIRVVPTSADAS